ncbi:MAG: Gfo/Idh/MocA family oxidoreductase [Acidimicrobiales bacterium]
MLRAGVIGAAFAGRLHAESLIATGRVEVAGVVSAGPASSAAFARDFHCAAYPDLDTLLAAERLDLVTIAVPNRFHLPATLAAAAAGVHVICEKPLAMNLAEADTMLDACRDAGVLLLYGEQLCFAPRYQRVRELIQSGTLGTVVQMQHWERHGGPHARWFHDPTQSGGGVLLDMGCHGIEVARWLLDKPPVATVHARLGIFKHSSGNVDDHALVTMQFQTGALAVIDSSWAAPGGIDERLEVLGTAGSVSADLARGQSLLVYSDIGVNDAAEKAPGRAGWNFIAHEEARTWGWHGEMAHFVDAITGAIAPEETGSDGRQVLEIVMAAYQSAATGAEVALPFHTTAAMPIEPWLTRR